MPKTGYVTIVGRPNAGKSTFLNSLIEESVSAVSSRPQTTQRTIPGIYTDTSRGMQIIFLDTPGIHTVPENDSPGKNGHTQINPISIHERINSEAFRSLSHADVILRFLDPTRSYGDEDKKIDTLLEKWNVPVIRVETKNDTDQKSYPHKSVDIHIDSMTKKGFDTLLSRIQGYLPEGEFLYPEDYYTDQSLELRTTEVVRETLFEELGEEIPYACYIEIASLEEKKKGEEDMLSISAYIHCESESQKVILIGKGGKKIQTIGTQSRLKLENILGKKVFLALRVKVHKNWRKDEKTLEKLFPRK